ncbi:MAG: alpha/beta hydrolase fold domain-containing protein [Gemmatimonadetes bacterium]|nr:alpha/beta hydrolase fold domain-containing protein [Gemmatimonadota bacterium]
MSWQARLINLLVRTAFRRRFRDFEPTPARIAALRRAFGQPRWMRERYAARARVTKVTDAPIPGEWVLPHDGVVEDGRTILYVHGGGYVFCSEETHRPLTTALANLARARVFAPAYRMAPEHRFPAAIDDVQAAAEWLLTTQGADPARTVVGGDSAGGGLAAALLVARRDAGLPALAGGLLFSPWMDLAATGGTIVSNDGRDAMFIGSGIANFARVYLGDAPATHPLASPHYAPCEGLPPLCIQVSRQEVLLDDARRLAAKARAAGVDVTLAEWDDLVHVWQMWTPYLPEAREALRAAAAWIVARTATAASTRDKLPA